MPQHDPMLVDLKDAAALVTQRYFRISNRTVERWPLQVKIVNHRRHYRTADVIAYAEAMIKEAPAVATGSPLHHSRRKLRLVADGSSK
jgi:hypothetical protein